MNSDSIPTLRTPDTSVNETPAGDIDKDGWDLIHKIKTSFTGAQRSLADAGKWAREYRARGYPLNTLATMLGCTATRISQLESFHQVRAMLQDAGRKPPANEWVLRPLSPYGHDREVVLTAWDDADEAAEVVRGKKGLKVKRVTNLLLKAAIDKQNILPTKRPFSRQEEGGAHDTPITDAARIASAVADIDNALRSLRGFQPPPKTMDRFSIALRELYTWKASL